jgi:hypothetical protein
MQRSAFSIAARKAKKYDSASIRTLARSAFTTRQQSTPG